MSFNYSGDPLSSKRDEVRFLIGDTDANDPQLTDREVEYFLENETNVYVAATNCARALVSKYARLVDMSVGDLSYSYSKRQDQYTALVQRLMLSSSTQGSSAGDGMPYAGGISRSDKAAVRSNADRVSSAFGRGMHDVNHPSGFDTDFD